jgi:hypothetical protein
VRKDEAVYVGLAWKGKTFVRVVGLLLVISVLGLSGCGEREEVSSVVMVDVGELSGSGVIIGVEGSKAVVATAAHVLGNLDEEIDGDVNVSAGMGNGSVGVRVYLGGEWRSCSDVWRSDDADLGILWVELSGAQVEGYSDLVAATIDKSEFDLAAEGDGIVVQGYEGGETLRSQSGMIQNPWIYTEDFQQYMLWGTADVYPGMSGCGVFSEKGFLLGILCGNNAEGDIAVLPLSIIEAQAASIGER